MISAIAEEEAPIYLPHPSDIPRVQQMLFQKRLPSELVLDIMAKADYTPKRRLTVSNNPLHPDNRDELVQYLDECWQLLVQCEMMAMALNDALSPGRQHVPETLAWSLGCPRYLDQEWYDYVTYEIPGSENEPESWLHYDTLGWDYSLPVTG